MDPDTLTRRIATLAGKGPTYWALPRTAYRVSRSLAHVQDRTDPVSRSRFLEVVLKLHPELQVYDTRGAAVRQYHSLALSENFFLKWAVMLAQERQAAVNLMLARLDTEIEAGRYGLVTQHRDGYEVTGMTAGPGKVVVRAAGRRRGSGDDILAWPLAGWRPGRHARPQDLEGEPLWECLDQGAGGQTAALFRAPTLHDAVSAVLNQILVPEDPHLLLRSPARPS